MNLWERVIEHHLRKLTTVSKNQFGFMPEMFTIGDDFLDKTAHEEISRTKRPTYDIY
jgi:hypothetical protein